jgi:tagatose 1,6-diphosphate aldolase
MNEITPGKLKGLKNISTRDGFFIISALDHRTSLRKMINPKEPQSVSPKFIQKLKIELTRTLSPHSSAVLLDPDYGMPASKKGIRNGAGLIISLEESGYLERNGRWFTELLKNMNPKKIKALKADAAKLLVYYRPKDPASRKQLQLVKKVSDLCRKSDLAFVCEIIVYPLKDEKDFENNFPNIVIDATEEVSKHVDVFKVQFPGHANSQSTHELRRNCLELNSVCDAPWVLLSGGIGYQEYLKQVKIASECNFSGVMVGRALWQEAFKQKSLQKITDFVRKKSLARLRKLTSVTREGMSWFDRVNV